MNQENVLTDEELVGLAVDGDEMAEETLIRRYREFVLDRAKPYFLPGAEQEDILQEGMMGLWKAIYAFDKEKCPAFSPFASMCVKRQILSAVKSYGRQKHALLNNCLSLDTPAGDDEGLTFMAALAKNAGPNMEDTLIHQEGLFRLEEKINEALTAQERQIFSLYAEGMRYQAIAQRLGKSVKSVDNTIQRTRKKLQCLLAEDP